LYPINDIKEDILRHETITAINLRKLKKLNEVQDVFLNHELIDQNNFKKLIEIDPDGILVLKFNGSTFFTGVEIELTRKTKDRYIHKFKLYIESDHYRNAIYFFDKIGIFQSYKKQLSEIYINSKIILCYHPELSSLNSDILKYQVFYQERDGYLGEILHAHK